VVVLWISLVAIWIGYLGFRERDPMMKSMGHSFTDKGTMCISRNLSVKKRNHRHENQEFRD